MPDDLLKKCLTTNYQKQMMSVNHYKFNDLHGCLVQVRTKSGLRRGIVIDKGYDSQTVAVRFNYFTDEGKFAQMKIDVKLDHIIILRNDQLIHRSSGCRFGVVLLFYVEKLILVNL